MTRTRNNLVPFSRTPDYWVMRAGKRKSNAERSAAQYLYRQAFEQSHQADIAVKMAENYFHMGCYTAARRICVDLLRARKRFREPERPPAQNDALSDGMTAALLKLSPADRAVVYCRVVEEEDYGAIAARFGKNEAWARKRFSLARKKLRLTLEKEDKHNGGF